MAEDPVAVAVLVAATLGACAAAIQAHSTLAAAITRARGVQLSRDAAGYAQVEAANAAALGSAAALTPAPSSPAAAPAVPDAPVPHVPAPVLPALPGDGKTIATLIHGGGNTAGLHATAGWLAGHADHLQATAASLHSSAGALDTDWSSAAATAALPRFWRHTCAQPAHR